MGDQMTDQRLCLQSDRRGNDKGFPMKNGVLHPTRVPLSQGTVATYLNLLERRVCDLDVDSSYSRGGHTASLYIDVD
jgi:hypothetical protein